MDTSIEKPNREDESATKLVAKGIQAYLFRFSDFTLLIRTVSFWDLSF